MKAELSNRDTSHLEMPHERSVEILTVFRRLTPIFQVVRLSGIRICLYPTPFSQNVFYGIRHTFAQCLLSFSLQVLLISLQESLISFVACKNSRWDGLERK